MRPAIAQRCRRRDQPDRAPRAEPSGFPSTRLVRVGSPGEGAPGRPRTGKVIDLAEVDGTQRSTDRQDVLGIGDLLVTEELRPGAVEGVGEGVDGSLPGTVPPGWRLLRRLPQEGEAGVHVAVPDHASSFPQAADTSGGRAGEQRARQGSDGPRSLVVGIPPLPEHILRRATAERRTRTLEPPPDAAHVVGPREVGDDRCEEVEPGRDVVGRVASARRVPAQAGEGDAEQVREEFGPEDLDERAPLRLGNGALAEGLDERGRCAPQLVPVDLRRGEAGGGLDGDPPDDPDGIRTGSEPRAGSRRAQYQASRGPLYSWMVLPPSTAMAWPVR
ncbi:MAG: hypothetical protein KatS3mg014_1987 [Actinomycetota bacterium]|nr:MAG: hypothetical protein KatS3mg014_1987 [Actinomycetota bacterium]